MKVGATASRKTLSGTCVSPLKPLSPTIWFEITHFGGILASTAQVQVALGRGCSAESTMLNAAPPGPSVIVPIRETSSTCPVEKESVTRTTALLPIADRPCDHPVTRIAAGSAALAASQTHSADAELAVAAHLRGRSHSIRPRQLMERDLRSSSYRNSERGAANRRS